MAFYSIYNLVADYFEDLDGTFVSQPRKYIDKLADTYKRLFNDDPPKGYKTPLDKNDCPELDTSEILEGDMAAKYLTMVGIFNGWSLWGDLTSMLMWQPCQGLELLLGKNIWTDSR